MTRAAKIGWVCGLAIGLVLCTAIGGLCYVAFLYVDGIQLADAGYAAMRARDYDRAAAELQAALKKPLGYDRQSLYYNRGLSLASCRRFDEAIADLTQALRYPLALPWLVYEWRGWCYEGKHEIEKALADYDEATRLDPNSGWTYYEKALIRFRKRDYDQALHDFDEAVRCEPNSAEALVMRARCYRAMNDLDHALASLDGAVTVDPRNASAYEQRSQIYGQQKQYDKRDRDLAEARRLDPKINNPGRDFLPWWAEEESNKSARQFGATERVNKARDLHLAANAAYEARNYDQAIARYDDLLIMDLGAAEASRATMNRGNAYSAKGDKEKAMRDYDVAILFDPENAGAYVNRGQLLSKERQHAEAQKDFAAALRLNPKQWEAYFDRAADFRDDGKLDEALADLTKAIDLNPTRAGSYVNRGGVYAMKGEIECALEDYDKALTIDSHLAEVHLARARIHSRTQNYAEAAHDLEKAEGANEKMTAASLNSIAWFRATSSEMQLRNGQKAVEAATKACIQSGWNHWAYIDTLAAAYAEAGDFAQAIKYQEKALELARASEPRLKPAQERLNLYRKGQPYREQLK